MGCAGLRRRKGKVALLFPGLSAECLPRTGDREPFFVKQPFDAKDALYVELAVHPLPGAALGGLQLRELSLPEAQYIAGQPAQAADLADAEIEFIWNQDFARSWLARGAFCGFMHGSSRTKWLLGVFFRHGERRNLDNQKREGPRKKG